MASKCQVLVVTLLVLCVSVAPVRSQYDPTISDQYICPPGFIAIVKGDSPGSPVSCDADQCYTEVVGCGPGNVCVQTPHRNLFGYEYQHECECNLPYVKGAYYGDKGVGSHSSCFIPGRPLCSPNPCENGGKCTEQFGYPVGPLPEGAPTSPYTDFVCICPVGFLGKTCALQTPDGRYPTPVLKTATPSPTSGPSPPPPLTGPQGVCGTGLAGRFPTQCYFNNDPQGRYVCCDAAGCDGFLPPDFLFPHCKADGYAPPGYGVGSSSNPPANPPPSGPPPSGSDQGLCGSGPASDFPTRCYFNSDPQGRYVCCDGQGCNGFTSDNLTPHCKNFGYAPPNFGVGTSATPTLGPSTSGLQGVCGFGAASSFPVRCWYNNDPQGRYVCCDSDGCDGFNPPDSFFPRCKSNGFVPPNL